MVSIAYQESAVEVLDILNHMDAEYVNKVPKKIIEFLQENSSKTYVSNLDHTKTIKDMELKPKTQAILGLLYMKYWANEEERISFENKLDENERKHRQEIEEKYNPDNLFKKEEIKVETKEEQKEEMQVKPVEKQTFIQKILSKIKKFLTIQI